MPQLLRCPMRIENMAWHMANDYDANKLAEKGDFSYLDQFGFSEKDKEEMIALYMEDREKPEAPDDEEEEDERVDALEPSAI